MNFGITTKSMNMIICALKHNPKIKQAAVFGSRSMGNFRKGSDIDIVIYGTNITMEMLNKLSIELNEKLPLPYSFGLVHYESLKHEELKNHIDAYGKVFYEVVSNNHHSK